jgi:hypothetical protein
MNVRMPDGTVIENVPEGITQSDLLARYQRHTDPAPPPQSLTDKFPELAGGDPLGQLNAAAVGLGYGIDRAAAGLRQIVPEGIRNAVDAFGAKLGMGTPPSIDPEQRKADKATLAPLESKYPMMMSMAESGPMLAAPTPATMALVAGLNYGTPQERTKEALLTYGAAKVGDLAAKGVSKVLGGDLMTQDAKTLVQQGVQVSPGQAMGLKAAEEKASSLPILGEQVRGAQRRGIESFNQATYARAVQPLGDDAIRFAKELPAGNEGIAKLGDYLGQRYEDALSKSVPTPLATDTTFHTRIAQLANMVPKTMQDDFVNALRTSVADRMESGVLTPTAAKEATSDLGRMASNYVHSSVASEREFGLALMQAQANLRQAIARANPETGPLIRAIDSAWSNLTQLERAGAKVGAKEGIFSPSQYLGAIKAGDKSARDRAFSRGEMPNQDFAQLADRVLSNRVPNSGTVDRGLGIGMALDALRHPLAGIGGLAGGLLAGIPYSPVGQKAVLSLLGGSAAQTPLQQEVLRRLGIAGGGMLGQAIGQ